MTSSSWKRTKKRRRRSEMRLGKTYEQVTTPEEPSVRSVRARRIRPGPRGGSLLLALVLVSLLAYVFISDSFYVYGVELSGNSLVSAEEIFQGSGVDGYSIFFIEPQEVEHALSSLPDVRQAEVSIRLPNRMYVKVRERTARVIWQTGEERYGVDDEGIILPLRGETESVILIRDLDSTPRQPGERVDLEIVAAAEKYASLLPQVRTFDYSGEYGLSLQNEFGWRIYLGKSEGAETKVAVMKELAERLANRGSAVEYIDLRFQDSPLYRLVEG